MFSQIAYKWDTSFAFFHHGWCFGDKFPLSILKALKCFQSQMESDNGILFVLSLIDLLKCIILLS